MSKKSFFEELSFFFKEIRHISIKKDGLAVFNKLLTKLALRSYIQSNDQMIVKPAPVFKPRPFHMNSTPTRGIESRQHQKIRNAHVILALAGLIALTLTFLLATSGLVSGMKLALFAAAASVFLLICIISFFSVRRTSGEVFDGRPVSADENFGEIDNRLIALDEANQFFGSSLNAADMFRLVTSRVGEIFPFSAGALIVPDEAGIKMKIAQFEGRNADVMQDLEFEITAGLSGKAVASRAIEIDEGLELDRKAIPAERLEGFRSSVAIPLMQDEDVFGVFELFTDHAVINDDDTVKLLEAIGEHVTPLFRSSLAFEQSISSALTDVLTGLPNERAFYMILENQLAESMRYRDERPLTVLVIDIKGFSEVNTNLGHQTGDRILEFTGDRIKEQLRKMDFLARTMNDEFAVILPTAAEKTALEIMERIRVVFAQTPFAISDEENVKIWLNFGWATFWKDGETANQLIRNAQLRKQQEKSEEPAGVLWFPKEYVN